MLKQRSLRIFIVDDEPLLATTLSIILQKSGHVATSFTNPLEALRSAERSMPDVLISDVMMPELSGIELAIRMRQIDPLCQVLLLSGVADVEDLLIRARELGHLFQLLCKPVHPTEILRRLERINQANGQSRMAGPNSASIPCLNAMLVRLPRTELKGQVALTGR